jgi:hypothetical protein
LPFLWLLPLYVVFPFNNPWEMDVYIETWSNQVSHIEQENWLHRANTEWSHRAIKKGRLPDHRLYHLGSNSSHVSSTPTTFDHWNGKPPVMNRCHCPGVATSGACIELLLHPSQICIFWLLATKARIKPNFLPCHANEHVFSGGVVDISPLWCFIQECLWKCMNLTCLVLVINDNPYGLIFALSHMCRSCP